MLVFLTEPPQKCLWIQDLTRIDRGAHHLQVILRKNTVAVRLQCNQHKYSEKTLSVASLFKCNDSYSCATTDKISTDIVQSLCNSWAKSVKHLTGFPKTRPHSVGYCTTPGLVGSQTGKVAAWTVRRLVKPQTSQFADDAGNIMTLFYRLILYHHHSSASPMSHAQCRGADYT